MSMLLSMLKLARIVERLQWFNGQHAFTVSRRSAARFAIAKPPNLSMYQFMILIYLGVKHSYMATNPTDTDFCADLAVFNAI